MAKPRRVTTPLDVAAEAARAADRAAQIAEDAQRHEETNGAPFTDLVDDEATREFEAADNFFAEVDPSAGPVRIDVHLAAPLPPGIRTRPRLATLDNIQAIRDPGGELVRIAQESVLGGRAGYVEFWLRKKEVNERGTWVIRDQTHTSVWAPANERIAAAASTNGAAPAGLGVKDVFEVAAKIEEQGKKNAPPTPTDPLDLLVKAKQAGLIGESTSLEKFLPLVAALSGWLEKMFAPRGPTPYETMMLNFMQAQLTAAKPRDEMKQMDTLLNFADRIADRLGGGGGSEGSLGIVALKEGAEVLRSYAPAVQRVADAIYLRNAGPRPGPRRPTRVEVVQGPAGALTQVLERASPWAVEAAASQNVMVTHQHFPELLRDLNTRVPGCAELLEDLRAGKVTEDDAFGAMQAIGVTVVEPLTTYLKTFLGWAKMGGREAPPTVAPPAGRPAASPVGTARPAAPAGAPALGRCESCRAEFMFDTRADLESETKPCDAPTTEGRPCGGKIVAVTEGA